MGYYVTIESCNWILPANNEQIALSRLKQLNQKDDLKRGGSWGPNGVGVKWFSWMPPDYDKTANSVEEIFKLLGFETDRNEEGLMITWYDSKTGQEELFLNEIADLVKPESFIVWRGEDGNVWKNVFRDGKMLTYSGRVTFIMEDE